MAQTIRLTGLLILMLTCSPVAAQNPPSLRIGNWLRIDPRVKLQVDLQGSSPHLTTEAGKFDVNRVRLGIEGVFLTHFEYEVEREFRETLGAREFEHPLRDAFLNFRYFETLQIRAGKFKVPFSGEQLTGVANLEFVNRSRIAEYLAPARDLGVVVHGEVSQGGLGYDAGVFRNDGENSESSADVRGGETYALRVVGMPLQVFSWPGDWDEVQFGVAATLTDVPEGLNSLRGRTISGDTVFSHVYVNGQRRRIGAEASWRPGPFSIQSEFIHVSEARKGQSVRADDLPAKISRGWYLTGTWAITGESKENGIEPRRAFLTEGIGAVELAARYEQIRFGSGGSGIGFSSPRAPKLLGNSDRVWTIGVNWYLNRFAKIQINGIQETIEDPNHSPIEGRERFRTGIVRFQFSM